MILLRRIAPSTRRQLAAAAIGAMAGAVAALGLDLPPAGVVAGTVLGASMAAIVLEDALRYRVPDRWVTLAVLAGLAWAAASGGAGIAAALSAMARAILGGVLCGGAFLLLREGFYRLRGVDGLGLGDVKLAAAGGIWLGWDVLAVAVLAAAAAALAVVVVRVLRAGNWSREQRLAFGAFLAPAIWCSWLLQQGGWAGA